MLNEIGIDSSLVPEEQARRPGSVAHHVVARAVALDACTFNDFCLVGHSSSRPPDYDGSVCTLCGAIWSQLPGFDAGFDAYECRRNGLCSVLWQDAVELRPRPGLMRTIRWSFLARCALMVHSAPRA